MSNGTTTNICSAVAISTKQQCQHPARQGSSWCAQHQDPSTRAPAAAEMPQGGAMPARLAGSSPEEDLALAALEQQPVLGECDEAGPELTPEAKVLIAPSTLPDRQMQILAMASVLESGGTPHLAGGTGAGKTAMVETIAAHRNCELIYLNASHMTHEKLLGLPTVAEDAQGRLSTPTAPPSWRLQLDDLAQAEADGEPFKQPMVFIDELTNADMGLSNALMGVINQDGMKESGQEGWRLPSNTLFVTAGNKFEHSQGASDLAAAMESRLVHFDVQYGGMEEWYDLDRSMDGLPNHFKGRHHTFFTPPDSDEDVLGLVMAPVMERTQAEKLAAEGDWRDTLFAFMEEHPEWQPDAVAADSKGDPSGQAPTNRNLSHLVRYLAAVPEGPAAPEARRKIMVGKLGDNIGRAFSIYSSEVADLPSPAAWMDNPSEAHAFRAERTGDDRDRPDKMKIQSRRIANYALRPRPEDVPKSGEHKWRAKQILSGINVVCEMGKDAGGSYRGRVVPEIKMLFESLATLPGGAGGVSARDRQVLAKAHDMFGAADIPELLRLQQEANQARSTGR